MDLFIWLRFPLFLTLAFAFALSLPISKGTSFTFVNQCEYTVWPGVLSNAGIPPLPTTGFELPSQSSLTLDAPTGWSGRFWGRTGCNFHSDSPQPVSCATADCSSGSAECFGAGPQPPVTLAEFTLGDDAEDFYDVSLVDGYNLPMLVEPSTGACGSTGCLVDLNRVCPSELKAGNGRACMSACEAFGTPEYCCSGAYGSPGTCRPTVYSEMFKTACPRSYSYAYDDASSIFTCTAADYIITFCPSNSRQQKDTTTQVTPMTTPGASGDPVTGLVGDESGSSGLGSEGTEPGSESTDVIADGSWLTRLAMGDSTKTAHYFSYVWSFSLVTLSFSVIILCTF